MLYKELINNDKQSEFIFEAKPYNEDIDFKEIAAIETFYEKNGYIPNMYISSFLNWLTYMARSNVTGPYYSVMNESMSGQCAVAQGYYVKMLDKLKLSYETFNVGNVLGSEPIHALTKVSIPTVIEGENISKEFILDPTFRQFCLQEENRFERYNEEPRGGVRKSTPHPGYFFNLTKEGRRFANNLICYGYFEATDDNLKQYFDPFALYITPKEDYDDSSLVGKINCTNTSGGKYKRRVDESFEKYIYLNRDFNYTTPKEKIETEQRKLFNKIKRKFLANELDELFEITDADLEQSSKYTK